MKKLIILLLVLFTTLGAIAQGGGGGPKYGKVWMVSNNLYQDSNGVTVFRGKVDFTGVPKLDVSNNLVISANPLDIKGLHTGANNIVIAHREARVWNSDNN